MKAQTEANLVDNAWVKRIEQLRRMVAEGYDPSLATPAEYVDYLIEVEDEEFDRADIDIILREAEERAAR